ncbi:ATP-binding protein [Hymenobacter busanensis]|uniref:ATP-binding protein n=1 Tax=Hymenobacter busanensis TaxID=2607656 RepID=A0A7L4ZWF8_9BACT|nr:AAA family ATPase [Hymenobacter busanensis]KAA9333478.1 ATP-binding protein [Hymenobacter busanensis]QHJ07839.1 AAA family ATPase [Hymenobacter busanensis]
MEFLLKKIGPIENARIQLGDLTVICGKNNQGKSYATHTIYGFLRTWTSHLYSQALSIDQDFISGLITTGRAEIDARDYVSRVQKSLSIISAQYKSSLGEIFSANSAEFAQSEFDVKFDLLPLDLSDEYSSDTTKYSVKIVQCYKEANSHILQFILNKEDSTAVRGYRSSLPFIITELIANFFTRKEFPNPFIISSERTGIHLFQKELDINKNTLVDYLMRMDKKKSFDPFDLMNETLSRYSLPIKANIDIARDGENLIKENSIFKDTPEISGYIERLLGIEYEIQNGQQIVKTKALKGKKKKVIPFYLASTSVRALSDLNIYIKHIAKHGDILIIDEPELNLHPENQIKMARLFAKLVNRGIKVFITTHSDYILKEINNLVMLSSDLDNKSVLINQLGYKEDEYILPGSIKAYMAQDGITSIEVDSLGLKSTTFDEAIDSISRISQELFTSIEDTITNKAGSKQKKYTNKKHD